MKVLLGRTISIAFPDFPSLPCLFQGGPRNRAAFFFRWMKSADSLNAASPFAGRQKERHRFTKASDLQGSMSFRTAPNGWTSIRPKLWTARTRWCHDADDSSSSSRYPDGDFSLTSRAKCKGIYEERSAPGLIT